MSPKWFLKTKITLYKLLFRKLWVKMQFPLLEGKELLSFREMLLGFVQYDGAVCNAGMIATGSGYLFVAKNQRFSFCNEIGVKPVNDRGPIKAEDDRKALYEIHLDEDLRLNYCNKLQVLLEETVADDSQGIEDVRLFAFRRSVWAYATGKGDSATAWPLYGQLESNELRFSSAKSEFSSPQKNWMPFEYEGELYLEYSIDPHIVLRMEPESSTCFIAFENDRLNSDCEVSIHGGAPSLRLNERYFLGVGNSQHRYWYQDRYYATVFYLFEAEPPFKLVKISKPLRVLSRAERIHYVAGMIFSKDRQSLILSIGICDCDNRVVVVPLDTVLHQIGNLE